MAMQREDQLMKWLHVAGVIVGGGLFAAAVYFERYGPGAIMAMVFLVNLAALTKSQQNP
jgi:hypothetical protein